MIFDDHGLDEGFQEIKDLMIVSVVTRDLTTASGLYEY
jgi:hypothetical protein